MKNMIKVTKKIYLAPLSTLFRPGGYSVMKFIKLLSKEY